MFVTLLSKYWSASFGFLPSPDLKRKTPPAKPGEVSSESLSF
jgi:hypothetical protein